MKLTCLIYADNQEKLRNIKTVIVRYCSPDISFNEITSAEEAERSVHPHMIVVDLDTAFSEIMKNVNLLKSKYPEAYFAVFVQYREFSFSNTALELENVEFLPLPVQTEMLQEAITRIIEHIGQIRGEMLATGRLSSVVNDNIPIIRQHYLSMLLRTGMPDPKEVKQKFTTLHIDCPGPYYTVLVADFPGEREKANYEAVSFLMLSALKSMLKSEGYQVYIFFDSDYRINCLIGHEQVNQEISLDLILSRYCTRATMYMDTLPYIGVGKSVYSTTNIHVSFGQAEAALKAAERGGKESILFYSNIEKDINLGNQIDQRIDQIVAAYFSHNLEQAKQLVEEAVSDGGISDAEKKSLSVKCYYHLLLKAEQTGVDVAEIPEVHRTALKLFDTADSILISQYLERIMQLLAGYKKKRYTSEAEKIIELTKRYIEENLSDSELSLEKAGRFSGFSKSYFCRLFHSVQGDSFSDYLKSRRIDRAKLLLEQTDMSVDEISVKTGFNSSKYFAVVFKQQSGVTPREYREMAKV